MSCLLYLPPFLSTSCPAYLMSCLPPPVLPTSCPATSCPVYLMSCLSPFLPVHHVLLYLLSCLSPFSCFCRNPFLPVHLSSILIRNCPSPYLSCIQHVLHQTSTVLLHSVQGTNVHQSCPATFLSFILLHVQHVTCPAWIYPLLYLSCPTSVLSCIHPVLHIAGPASVLYCICLASFLFFK